MAETIVFGLVQEVLKNLGSRALNEIASTWGFKDRLDKLNNTITIIKDVLLDAEEKQTDSQAVRTWLQQLATVVYAADDLFDEFNTIASRKQLLGGSKLSKEVRTFFSTSNQIAFAIKLSRNIKSVREKLEAIRRDGADFGLAQRLLEQGSVIIGRRDETHSYVDADEVIGRDADKNAILRLLLASNSSENEYEQEVLHVLPIVGIGGMGKTTLAQLIYNDPQVHNYFELRLWVCVAEDFDVKVITENILSSATDTETPKLNMEQLQRKLRDKVNGKKYLLILDDVWEENPDKWGNLKPLLKIGGNGSKILVTTRSRKVAEIMGTFPPHELQVLSEEKSWELFEKMAFKSGEAQQKPHLVNVGKELVKKCAYVPLAIVSLGRLLRIEHESKWLLFKDRNLADVMSVLKLSYQHLLSPLKNCFAYCALFPKDYEFKKEMLIELWLAEGFIIPGDNKGQSLENVADDYFQNLLQRGFFQDVKKNEWEDITRCKMHDLIHDLAQEEAKTKCKVAKFNQIDFPDTILHLSFADSLPSSWETPKDMLNLKLLRTLLFIYSSHFLSKSTRQKVVTKFHHLRVLDLHGLNSNSLPSSIGRLFQLRYLNLSDSAIEILPYSITNLYNLQTLNLESCWKLKTLPIDIQKLVNLMSLNVSGCDDLTHMPSGIGELTLLYRLPMFIVSHKQDEELRKKPTCTTKPSDLKKLNNLKGALSIRIYRSSRNNISEAAEADLRHKHGLVELNIYFNSEMASETNKKNHDEAVLEGLEPHCNLRSLKVDKYEGEKMPRWAMMDNLCKTLPNLVAISLSNCGNCQQVPFLSQLRFLKRLYLEEMKSVEYMESEVVYPSQSSKSQGIENIFFPSLEELKLSGMENLKGWWKEEIEESISIGNAKGKGKGASNQQHDDHLLSLQFLKLSELRIKGCPNLIFLPLCPNLEDLTLKETNKKLSVLKMSPISSATTSTSSLPSSGGWSLKLKNLRIDDVEDLISLSQLGLGRLSRLWVTDKKMESTERLGDVFATLSSSLRYLVFWYCNSLRSISKGLEHLTALDTLYFINCEEMEEGAENESEDSKTMPWLAFKTSLRSLGLHGLIKVERLPSGIQHLSNLRSLDLSFMEELREIPEWISCLTSLQYLTLCGNDELKCLPQTFQNLTSLMELEIKNCEGLWERCQSPNGADWPKIKHIPRVFIQGQLQVA